MASPHYYDSYPDTPLFPAEVAPTPEIAPVKPLVILTAGVMNFGCRKVSTTSLNMLGLATRLESEGLEVEEPVVPPRLGSGTADSDFKYVSRRIDQKLDARKDDVFPVLVGHSKGGLLSLAKYLELRQLGIDCGLVTLNSPHLGLRNNFFIPQVPIVGNVLRAIDPYSLVAAQLGRYSLSNVARLADSTYTNNVTFIGSTKDIFATLGSTIPAVNGATRIALTHSGKPAEGFEDVETYRAPYVEHAFSPCQTAVSEVIARRIVEMTAYQPEGQGELLESPNIIQGHFGRLSATS